MTNIDIFKSLSGLIMAELYDSFPIPIKVRAIDFAQKLDDEYWNDSTTPDPDHQHIDLYNPRRSPAAIAAPTIEWLSSAGLISYKAKNDHDFIGVVLTPKGLQAIESDTQRGQNMLLAAQNLAIDASKDAAKDQLKNLFSDVLKWCIEKSPYIVNAVHSIT
jgi:DNA-binding protein YbaB